VASFSSAARTLVPVAVADLLAEHPHVEVQVIDEDPGQALPMLRLAELDVVIGHDFPFEAPLADPGFHRVELMDDELALALGPSRHDLAPDFRALEGQPWIAGHVGTSCDTVVVRACRAAGHEPTVIGRSNDYGVVLQLVARDLGISIAPRITHDLAPPGVRLVSLRPRLSRRIIAVTRAGAERRPTVAAMLGALRTAAQAWGHRPASGRGDPPASVT
jgi:DNA-binding transcriptional LysR family regulator